MTIIKLASCQSDLTEQLWLVSILFWIFPKNHNFAHMLFSKLDQNSPFYSFLVFVLHIIDLSSQGIRKILLSGVHCMFVLFEWIPPIIWSMKLPILAWHNFFNYDLCVIYLLEHYPNFGFYYLPVLANRKIGLSVIN